MYIRVGATQDRLGKQADVDDFKVQLDPDRTKLYAKKGRGPRGTQRLIDASPLVSTRVDGVPRLCRVDGVWRHPYAIAAARHTLSSRRDDGVAHRSRATQATSSRPRRTR